MKKLSRPKELSDELAKLLEKLKDKPQNVFAVLTEEWDGIAEENIRKCTQLLKIENDVLYIGVGTSSQLYELNTQYKRTLLEAINERFGEGFIKNIIFMIQTTLQR